MLILPWKFMFTLILMVGSLIAISASSWMMAWMGLEINMLALLALFMAEKSPRNSEASLKYFLVQALASAILISSAFSASSLFSFLSSINLFSSFIMLSLIVKLGGAPFHMWVPQISEGLTWNNNLILLTWQKIAPFFLLSSCLETNLSYSILMVSIIMSSILGGMMGLSQSSTRKILAFSSINHIGWMLSSLLVSISLWLSYFLIYSSILVCVMLFSAKFNINSINNSFLKSPEVKISFFVCLMSFGGLPPLLGFLPKWIVIQNLAQTSTLLLMILVMSSLMALFFYMRLAFSSLLFKNKQMNQKLLSSKLPSVFVSYNLLGLITFPLIFMF